MEKEKIIEKITALTFCAGCRKKYCFCTCGEGKWVIDKNDAIELLK